MSLFQISQWISITAVKVIPPPPPPFLDQTKNSKYTFNNFFTKLVSFIVDCPYHSNVCSSFHFAITITNNNNNKLLLFHLTKKITKCLHKIDKMRFNVMNHNWDYLLICQTCLLPISMYFLHVYNMTYNLTTPTHTLKTHLQITLHFFRPQ